MLKSVLIRYLKQLSKKDWREFRKMVHSPYYNQREDLARLVVYLESKINTSKATILDKKAIFEATFPGKDYDEQQLRYALSFLLKVLKKYLLQTELEEDEVQQQIYLSRALRKRGLDKYAEKELKLTSQILEKQNRRNSFYHYQRYQLTQEELSLTLLQKRSGIANFQTVSEELTISYIADILRHSCSLLTQQSMSRQSHHLQLLEAALQLVDHSEYQQIPAIAIYFRIYRALYALEQNQLDTSEEEFNIAKQLVEQHWPKFPAHEIREIYLFTTNYCIRRLNNGERQFVRKAFELFRSGLKNEALLNRGFLSSFTYKNITRLGVALQEDEWVEQFLQAHKKQLHPRERENTWRYNLAFFYFQKADYEQSMRLLQQVEFKDPLNNLDARQMLLRSYFELKEYDALDSFLDSFSNYIYRQKEVGYHREIYINLVRFVRKMIQLQGQGKEEWKKLREEVQATSQLAGKKWLLEQLEE